MSHTRSAIKSVTHQWLIQSNHGEKSDLRVTNCDHHRFMRFWNCDSQFMKKCDFWDFTTFTILFYNSERNRNCQKTIKTFRKRDSIIFVSDLLRVVPCVVNDKFLNLVTNNFSSQTTVWQKKKKCVTKGEEENKVCFIADHKNQNCVGVCVGISFGGSSTNHMIGYIRMRRNFTKEKGWMYRYSSICL